MKGKAYAHKSGQRKGDGYDTPKSLFWVAENIIREEFDYAAAILEPCCGNYSISEEILHKLEWPVVENDLYGNPARSYCLDYLESNFAANAIITNPPFSLWDKFVKKAKSHCNKFMLIGRLNYFGTYDRSQSGIWDHLKAVYPFNRYVDYQTPYRTDGLFHVGAMATAWFLWDMNFVGDPIIKVLDVQQYAKLGNIKN